MKHKLFIIASFLFLLSGCNNSDQSTLELSETSLNVGTEETTLTFNITSNSEWHLSSNVQWCTPDKTTGANNATITLRITQNIDLAERTTKVIVTSSNTTKSIQINQKGYNSTAGEYHYKIPVIFHVLYADKSNRNQYVDKGRLAAILDECNKRYKAQLNSVDMNLEFVPAVTDPHGNILPEPGVERIQWSNPVMDSHQFMSTESQTNKALIWDPDQYINVMIYTFSSENGLGISHLPYSLTSNFLEGLNPIDFVAIKENLMYPYCISINNTYIYSQSGIYYDANDVTVTLTHELGHYLGLYHVYSEGEDGNIDLCLDTDYCKDTPTYNRKQYNDYLLTITGQPTLKDLCKRNDCSGKEFFAHNFMDYSYCYFDQFTSDQRNRIRHVLTYSPLIPGPKKGRTKTYTVQGAVTLPIRAIN